MSGQLLRQFLPPVQMAYEQGALTECQAWQLDQLLMADYPPSPQENRLLAWVNLVNSPEEWLTEH